jgi:hypothetical protein
MTSSLPSPPFKPFQPLPEVPRRKPPTPPPKLLDFPPYRDTFSYLAEPSQVCKTEALEILQNKEMTDVHRAREEWKKQDEERERIIKEKKEERERLLSGTGTIRAPTMQTVTALVVDQKDIQQPPPPPPPKEKRSLWKRLFGPGKSGRSKQQPVAEQPTQMNAPVIIPFDPQRGLSSIPGAVIPMQMSSHPHSSSSHTLLSPGRVVQPTPAPAVIPVSPGRTYGGGVMPGAVGPQVVMPAPSIYPTHRSTTPNTSPPPNTPFFSIPAAINM